MKSITRNVFFNGLSLYLLSLLDDVVRFDSGTALLWTAFILGFLNVFVRPVLTFLTFPLKLLTFGFFTVVLNVFLLFLTSLLVKGFYINPLTINATKLGGFLVPSLNLSEFGSFVFVSLALNLLNAIFWRLL